MRTLMQSGSSLVGGESHILELLSSVPDPEIPVLSVLDLGIVRKIETDDHAVTVTITPTYSGCPAMKVFEEDIISCLRDGGYEQVRIKTVLSPAWTTDWISEEGKNKLLEYGIAPPAHSSSDKGLLMGRERKISCPRCRSQSTELISQFGSTACKALYKCKDCLEPFDYFKCI